MSQLINKLSKKPYFRASSSTTQEQVAQAQQVLGLKFSDDYREYVLAYGVAAFDGHELTGVCNSERLNVADVTIFERGKNPSAPVDWYVVEQAHIDGIVIWQSSTGEVYQTMPNAPAIKLCDSFCEYIDF